MSDKQDLCRRLFETAAEALLVIQAGQIVEANASAAALLGCSKEALLNQTLLHFSPLAQPDGSNSAQALPEKMAAALAGQVQRFEWLCQTSTGETVFTEMALSGVEFEGEAYLRVSIHDISRYKHAETELIRERNLLRSLIDKLPETNAFVKDTASRFIFTNAAHLNVIGVDRLDQVIGKTDFDFFSQELAEQYFADEQAVIQSGQPLLNSVEPGVDSGGHKKWYLTNKLPLLDENNQVIGLVGMSLDITKRKEMEESLRQSQQLLQVVMDNIPQSIFWKDSNLTYLGCNRAFAEDANLPSAEAIIGKTDFEMVWREQADLYRADDRQVIEVGQPKLNYEEPQTTAAGTQIWLRTSKVPIHGAEGQVVAVLGMYEDITEQKRAEEALQESERRLANIIDFLPSPTFVIDREGTVIAWNQAIEEALGVKAEDILGKGNYEYALPFYGERRPILIDLVFEPLDKIEQKYFNVRREGDTLSAEAHVFPRGQERYFVGTAAPMYDAQGNVIGAIQTLRDATEQKQSELALQESEQRLSDIINFLPTPTFVIDREGQVIAWNQAIAEVTGVTAEDILGKGNYEYALPFFDKRRPLLIDLIFEPEEEVARNYTNVRREGRTLMAENRVFPRGIERYYDLSAAGLYDSQGNLVGAIEAFRDITEQKQAEEELTKYRDQLEELVEARTIELEDRVRELNALQHLMSHEGWQAFQSVREQATPAYLFDHTSVRAATMAELGLARNGNTPKELVSQAAAGNGHLIAKPLTVHGEFIGALGIQTKSGEPLPPEDQAFLDAVAEQAAEALERARLLEQVQKRATELGTLGQISRQLSALLNLEPLVSEVVDQVRTAYNYYHAQIYLFDEAKANLILAGSTGAAGQMMLERHHSLPTGKGLVGRAAAQNREVLASDVSRSIGVEIVTSANVAEIYERELDPGLTTQWYHNFITQHFGEVGALAKAGTGPALRLGYVLHVLNDFTQAIRRGAEAAASQLGVELEIVGPAHLGEHLPLFEDLVNQDREGLVTIPHPDGPGWGVLIRQTIANGIPVVAVNAIDREHIAASLNIYQSNFQSGVVLSREVAKLLTAEAQTTGLIMVGPGPSERLAGFKYGLRQTDYTISQIDQPESGEAVVVETYWAEAIQRQPDLIAAVGLTSMDIPALANIKRSSGGRWLVAGYDLSPLTLQAIQAGLAHLTIGQHPYLQGYLPILALVEHLRHHKSLAGWIVEGWLPNPLLPETRTELAVPIASGGQVLGVLDIQHNVPNSFSQNEVQLLRSVADQVAVALQNANQYQQTQSALAEVQQSQVLLRSIIDATPDWIFVKDREHRYRLVNQSYADSMHVSLETFIGKNDLDIGFPEEIVKGNPEKGIRGFWADDREVMDSGQIRVIDVEPAVVNGRPVFLSTIKVPLRDASGDVWGVLGFIRDITQREQLLAQTENLFKTSRRLNEARDLQDLVAVLAEGGPVPVINRAGLLEFEYNSLGEVEAMVSVANWFSGKGTPPPPLGFRIERSIFTSVNLFLNPEPTFFDDAQHDERMDPASLALTERNNMRALAVLPLQVGARQWGVLILDGEEPYPFTQREMQPYIALARQLAVALENRRLLAETQAALAEVERTQRRYTVQAWESYRDRLTTLSYEQVREGVTPLGDNLLPEITQAMTERRALTGDQRSGLIDAGPVDETDTDLIVPLTVRGEVIGVLGLQETDEGRVWSPEEIALIEAISEQLAQAAENIRLIDESQQRAAREKRVNEIGEKIRAAQSLEEALQIAVKEVGLSLQAPQTMVKLEVK